MTVDDALSAARLVLERLGVSPQDLIDHQRRETAVTIADLIPEVVKVVPEPTGRLYRPYWRKMVEAWPDRLIGDVKAADVLWFVNHCKTTAVVRASSRGGHSAAEHGFEALRCLIKFAVVERLVHPWDDPTLKVARPKRLTSKRRALKPDLVEAIVDVAATTGDDPRLDALLLRFHIETAARRGGALALRLGDLDRDACLVLLREKGDRDRWQPVSPTLMAALVAHAHARGVRSPNSKLFRFYNGNPLSARRYDYLWARIGEYIDTVSTQGITTHWLRHTTLTWVERAFGYAVARAYAGHATASGNRFGVTASYVKADLADVAAALAALTQEPHPMAIVDSHAQEDRSDGAAANGDLGMVG